VSDFDEVEKMSDSNDSMRESTGSFIKDPLKVVMALVIIILLAYIATRPDTGQQANAGNNQTSNSQLASLTDNSSAVRTAVNVRLTVVNDEKCILCDTSGIEMSLSGIISNLTITNVSYSSSEGMALLQQYNATGVPLYVFDSSIEKDPSYSNLSAYLQKSGSTYALVVRPVEFLDRTARNNSIQLFVMSMGQYGTSAEKATKEVLDAVPDLKFDGLHFVATDFGNGTFSSPQGPKEIAEDLRQVCIMKYYPEELINYTSCIDADYNNSMSIWQNCSKMNGIDANKMETCSTGSEGTMLLSDNIALTTSLGIYSSPTILLNNNTVVNGNYITSAELLKEVVCIYNPVMNGCNKTLSGAGNSSG
jgi:hypothetical protein